MTLPSPFDRLADLLGWGEELKALVAEGHRRLDERKLNGEGAALGLGGLVENQAQN